MEYANLTTVMDIGNELRELENKISSLHPSSINQVTIGVNKLEINETIELIDFNEDILSSRYAIIGKNFINELRQAYIRRMNELKAQLPPL